MEWWWWVMIGIGPLLGLAGAVYGTMNSVRMSRGPMERAFVIQASLAMGGGLLVFFALLMLLPEPWNSMMWVPYGFGLAFSIRYFNRRQQEIREREESCVPPVSPS